MTDGRGEREVEVQVDEAEAIEVLEGEVVDEDAVLALFGEQARTDYSPAMPMPDFLDLKREWMRAWDQWLDDSANSPKTVRLYRRAWKDLLNHVGNLPASPDPNEARRATEFWEITHRHIRSWMDSLESRPLDPRRVEALRRRGSERRCGYANSTINAFMAAISSFYSYAEQNWPVMLPSGKEVPLTWVSGVAMNPVKVVKRKPSGARKREQPYLSLVQIRRLLAAIPQDTAAGQRDRALFTFYIMTGARNTEARTLTWGDLDERGGRYFWYWRGKGRGRNPDKQTWKELAPECYTRIVQYLKAVGRWASMSDEDYIFTAVSDAAANLPTVSADAWDPHAQPLSAREVNRRLKGYAERAGLDPLEIHVHTLRHSAAMLMDEAGADLMDIMRFLNHENVSTTQIYMEHMKGQKNVHMGKMAELLHL
jgi:integrase